MSFVGVRGNSYLGDISLDEISVSEAEDCKVLEGLGTANDVVFNGDEGEPVIAADRAILLFKQNGYNLKILIWSARFQVLHSSSLLSME